MMIRKPAVAGSFYPEDRDELISLIENLFKSSRGPGNIPIVNMDGERRILGLISPHAGYIYSGEIAAHGFHGLAGDGLPETVILIGPNHTGMGGAISVYPGGYWETPLGRIKVNEELTNRLVNIEPYIILDDSAHIYEHSLEVQLPFLQYIYNTVGREFDIIPITMMHQTIDGVKILGEGLVKLLEDADLTKYILIASTDFSHYVYVDRASKLDKIAINKILNLDYDGLIDSVYRYDITMCGYGPVATLLYVASRLATPKVELLKYGHSGEVLGDESSVVAYASFIIHR